MDEIQRWIDSVLEETELQWIYWRDSPLDDTFGWGAALSASILDNPDATGCGLFLTGPRGCGKHTAARHAMKALADNGYEMLLLEGSELTALGTDQAIQRFEAVLDQFNQAGKSLCVCLEGMEDSPIRRELLTYWGRTLRIYSVYRDQFKPLYFILIDNREESIPALLRERLRLCRMSEPNENQRMAFLEPRLKYIRDGVSPGVFAEHTGGASYGQLLDMVENLQWLRESQPDSIDDDQLRRFLSQQMPPFAPEDELRGIAYSIVSSMNQLVENLPQLVERSVVAQVDTASTATKSVQPQITNQDEYMENTRQEIENMDPGDLINELFGKEAVEQALQSLS